jgi:hypothetical protein
LELGALARLSPSAKLDMRGGGGGAEVPAVA